MDARMGKLDFTPGHRVVVPLALVLAAMVGCGEVARQPDLVLARRDIAAHAYTDPQPVGSYPSSEARINGWIGAGQTDSIRAHAWDIWQSLTAMVNDSTPTWQTFYSGHELFDSIATPTPTSRPHALRLPVELAKQVNHFRFAGRNRSPLHQPIPVDTFERVFAFNRFSRTTAHYIWDQDLNQVTTLWTLNMKLASATVPLADREVLVSADSTDPLSFVTKVVFQFIRGDTVTAIPYWHGYSSANTRTDVPGDTLHPPPRFWKQAVAVDPSGRYQPGDSVFLPVNDSLPPAWLTVVPLSSFYYVQVTAADSANLTSFGVNDSGDDLGFNSDTSAAAVAAAARPGNYGLMLAMHVTGKEIPNWTWQSYWWTPFPDDSLGSDRPASIPSPWNNYVMTTAYAMTPIGSQSNVAFNPYLETSLAGITEDGFPWTGVISNCMSCHRRAAVGYGWDTKADTVTANAPLYGPAANVDPGDSTIFLIPIQNSPGTWSTLKTDFLWSVTLRAGLFQSMNSGVGKTRKGPANGSNLKAAGPPARR